MNLNEWFDQGLSVDAYLQTMDELKDGHQTIYSQFELPADDKFFHNLESKNIRTIILAEVWCGHCMLNIPIFLHISKRAKIPVKILPRDDHLELMDQYLTNGNRTIPIFIFIDEEGNEVGKWGPMAETTRAFVTPLREKLPAKDDETYDEKFREMVQITSKAFKEDRNLWSGVYESMKKTLENI